MMSSNNMAAPIDRVGKMSNFNDEFHSAVRHNNRAAIECYLKKGVDINCFYYGMTPLHVAITKDHTDLAVFLIGKGADVTKSEIDGRTTPFEEAVIRDQVQVVENLARQGVNVDSALTNGELGITTAASRNHIAMMTVLIKAGADINLPNKRGETALWLSARDGHTGVVELLVKAGANKNEKLGEDQLSPLLCSVINEHLTTTKQLVQAGCDVNLKDSSGWTALWHAVSNSNEPLVRALLTGNPDLSITDQDGRTLFDEARENEDEDIIQLLNTTRR